MPPKKSTPKKKSSSRRKPRAQGARSGNSRPSIERVFAIHKAVQRGRYPNCNQLGEEIGVSRKTLQRDISFMKNNLGLPLAYDASRHGYFYERPVHEFPLMRYGVEDVVALFLARKAIEPLQDSPLEASLRESFRRLSSALQGEVSFRWSDLDEAFSVKGAGVVPADVRLFEKLARAVLECRVLRFDYRKLDADGWERRKVRPFHLAECDGGWYLIGYDEDRRARRTFAVQRMKEVQVRQTQFPRPADFDLAEHLGGSFGVWHRPEDKGKRRRIRLRFTGWAARMVSERRWHPSQELQWQGERDEVLEMVLELSRFEEIRRWILSWGPLAEVLEPGELREEIAEALDRTREQYGPAV